MKKSIFSWSGTARSLKNIFAMQGNIEDLKEKQCVCGDEESQHVDGVDQCFIPECGCKEFEEFIEGALKAPFGNPIKEGYLLKRPKVLNIKVDHECLGVECSECCPVEV